MAGDADHEVKTARFWLAVLAEFVGTGLLVLVGCGSCDNGDIVRISLAFGFSVATIVWVTAHVSGGHINPAITAGFLLTRKIGFVRALLYVIAQSLGALAGAGILKAVRASDDELCTPVPGPGISAGNAFIIELLITFVLLLAVFATCDSLRSGIDGSGPLAIGLAITMCHLWAVPYTGSAMNPARAFGPAVVSGYLHYGTFGVQAMYWFGPLLGGVMGAVLYDFLFAANSSVEKAKAIVSERDYDDSNFDKEGRRSSGAANSGLHLTEEPAAEQDYGTLH